MKMKEMTRKKIAIASHRHVPNQCANDFACLILQMRAYPNETFIAHFGFLCI